MVNQILTDLEISKKISHALRHEPWLYEIELDDEGWTSLDQLIGSLRSRGDRWAALTPTRVAIVISGSEKKRHEISGTRIRALYGHSIPGKLKYTAAKPPAVLYHGTSPELSAVMERNGLKPMGRQYVHLSSDWETARQIGLRKCAAPLVLVIAAGDAHASGLVFYEGNENVWLADSVPPSFIEGWASSRP